MKPIGYFHGLTNWPIYMVDQEGWAVDEIHADGNDQAWVIDGSGWKLSKRSVFATSLISVSKVEGMTVLDGVFHLQAAKIPEDLFRRVVAFFKEVYQLHKSEAAGLLVYQPSSAHWDFVVPTQQTSGASARYGDSHDPREACKEWLDRAYVLAGTIHSHGSMSAFHSGTDDKDEEQFEGIHITVGRVDQVPEYAVSAVVGGKRLKFDSISALVEMAHPTSAVPSQWLQAVKGEPPREACGKDADQEFIKLWWAFWDGKCSEREYLVELDALRRSKGSSKNGSLASAPLGLPITILEGNSGGTTTKKSKRQRNNSSYLDGAFRHYDRWNR